VLVVVIVVLVVGMSVMEVVLMVSMRERDVPAIGAVRVGMLGVGVVHDAHEGLLRSIG
jgi:hypothetical protein